MSAKHLLVVFVAGVLAAPSLCAVTVEQMQQSILMVRQVCQPKFKVSDALVDGLGKQQFPEEKPLKCYTHCMFEMLGILKKTKLNYDAAIKQIDMMMPDDMKEPNKRALSACKDVTVGLKDPCEAGYAALKCVFKNNPDFMF